MAGRPPKPTALKKLQGNPGHRPLAEDEPKPTLGVPSRPEWLSPEAKREWSRLAPELERMGLIAVVDRAMFSAFCQSWATYTEMVQDLRENGTSYQTDKGYQAPRPEVGILFKALDAMRRLSALFGLTPADRGRIHLGVDEQEDEFTKFLKQKANGG